MSHVKHLCCGLCLCSFWLLIMQAEITQVETQWMMGKISLVQPIYVPQTSCCTQDFSCSITSSDSDVQLSFNTLGPKNPSHQINHEKGGKPCHNQSEQPPTSISIHDIDVLNQMNGTIPSPYGSLEGSEIIKAIDENFSDTKNSN